MLFAELNDVHHLGSIHAPYPDILKPRGRMAGASQAVLPLAAQDNHDNYFFR